MRAELQEVFQEYELRNIWNSKAEILSDNNFNISDNKTIVNDIKDNNIEELQLLINELLITDPLNIEEYININDEILAEEKISLEEIVNLVKGKSAIEDEMEEEHEIIVTSDILNSIKKLIKYVQ
ncbi:11265_t:CDS:2 [Funneliformis caledonium]|uniref:11265_t:CDS:1 n=1 Tax=Funneliformis caledonium TaxID=1117310 RepID=A0A9N9H575_9GLOM|nr:11265_t:CDS:2 [Funneliformis caledonium]